MSNTDKVMLIWKGNKLPCEDCKVVFQNKFGKEYMGIERTTFLIDTEGKIEKIWRNLDIDNHVNEILNFLDQ